MKQLFNSLQAASALLLAIAVSAPVMADAAIGTPLTPEITIASVTGGGTLGNAIASDAAGNFIVLWQPVNGSTAALRHFAADGTSLTDAIPVSGFVFSYSGGGAQLAMDSAGDFVLVWTQLVQQDGGLYYSYAVYAQVYAPDGTSTTGPFIVAQSPSTSTTNVKRSELSFPIVAMAPDGDFIVGWSGSVYYGPSTNYRNDVLTTSFAQSRRYHLNGTPYGNAINIAYRAYPFVQTTAVGLNKIAIRPDGSFVALWADRRANNMQFYSADDKPMGKAVAFTVPGANGAVVSLVDSLVSLAGNGDLLIANQSYVYDQSVPFQSMPYTVYYQRYSSQGVAKSAAITVGTGIGPAGLSINATSSSGSMLTWADFSTNSIYSKAFAVDDTPIADTSTDASGLNFNPNYILNLATTLQPNDDLIAAWGAVTAQIFQGP